MLHAPVIEALDAYRIAAVATSRAEAGERRDRPTWCADIDALLAIDAVELVVVVTPNDLHAAHAEAALRAGRHVVIDKPMAPRRRRLRPADRPRCEAGRVLSVYHNRRWDGDYLRRPRLLADGAIGTPALYEARWDRFRPEAAAVWRNAPGAGPGCCGISGRIWSIRRSGCSAGPMR